LPSTPAHPDNPGPCGRSLRGAQKDLICPVVISAELGCAIAQIGVRVHG
jgi:hypothetical protein